MKKHFSFFNSKSTTDVKSLLSLLLWTIFKKSSLFSKSHNKLQGSIFIETALLDLYLICVTINYNKQRYYAFFSWTSNVYHFEQHISRWRTFKKPGKTSNNVKYKWQGSFENIKSAHYKIRYHTWQTVQSYLKTSRRIILITVSIK